MSFRTRRFTPSPPPFAFLALHRETSLSVLQQRRRHRFLLLLSNKILFSYVAVLRAFHSIGFYLHRAGSRSRLHFRGNRRRAPCKYSSFRGREIDTLSRSRSLSFAPLSISLCLPPPRSLFRSLGLTIESRGYRHLIASRARMDEAGEAHSVGKCESVRSASSLPMT